MSYSRNKIFKYSLILIFLSLCFLCFPSLAEATEHQKSKIGIIVTQLGDFNTINNTFSATIWLWSLSKTTEGNPIRSLEFPNAVDVTLSNIYEFKQSNGVLVERQIGGVFRHNWDKVNFPFDKQVLQIVFEENQETIDSLSYEIEKKDTYFDDEINLPGWLFKKITVLASEKLYKTNFGEEESSFNSYARLLINIELERNSLTGFWKLTITAFIAAAIGLVSYFLSHVNLMAARMGLLVGSVFATAISMRSASGDLGSSNELTLVDLIHIFIFIYLLVAIIMSVYSWRHFRTSEDQVKNDRFNLISAVISTLALAISIALTILTSIY